jgi:hydrophobic/amphiphilic exporter-1 (mainly G- bacteria), HAE1 family
MHVTWLTRLALRFRTVTLLVVVLLVAGGILAVARMNQELFPSIEPPYLIVSAIEPGAGPNTVDQDLAVPIEATISSTEGLRHVQTTSLEGIVIVSAEYEFGIDMAATQATVQQSLASAQLPSGVATPRVLRVSVNSFPIYTLAVSGSDPEQLQAFVAGQLEPAVSSVAGVADVNVAGTSARVVAVVLDPAMLAASGVSPADVTAALRAADISVPVGGVTADGTQFPVRVVSSTSDLAQVQAVPVLPITAGPGAAPVTLGDLGTVQIVDGGAGSTISRLDGQPAVTLEVIKSQDANTVETVGNIQKAIDELQTADGIRVQEVVNQAPEIKGAVSDLGRDAAVGALLAVVMILLFLRSFRGTLVSGMTIPLSLLVAFIIMKADNITLNILTLGALSVAAGRVIDDGIVVLENIHRLLDEGLERTEAVLKGTAQMVPAITASTITTVAVFLPLAFVGGLVGEVFVGFALTVTFALLASLFVAVTVVPVLAQTFLRRSHTPQGDDAGAKEEFRMRAIYRRPLRWALGHRWTVVGAAVVLLFLSLGSLAVVPTNLFPSGDVTALAVSVNAAPGSSLQATSMQVAKVEAGIAKLGGVEQYTTVIGTSTDPLAALTGGGSGGSSSASISVTLKAGAEADALTTQIEGLVQSAGLAGAVSPSNATIPGGSDLSVQVTGQDFEAVTQGAAAVARALETVDGLEAVASNVAVGRPEFVVNVDPAKAAAFGLNAEAVAGLVRSELTPSPATTVVLDGAPHQVIVASQALGIGDPAALGALPIAPGVMLSDVATVDQATSPTAVTRYDRQRSAEVTGTMTSDNVGKVTTDVQSALDGLKLPPGVDWTLGGASEMMQESFSALGIAMLIAIALVYLAMVSTFGSLITPFVILLTLPLAAIGAFPALLITGRDLSLPAMLGLLMLVGIVVTNAIVMLEFVERLKREDGLSTYDALMQGAQIRLRPILMTALVTILALMPLALGLSAGALLSTSLATVVIGGLFSSTLLTLIVIPVVYSLFDGLRQRFARHGEEPSSRKPEEVTV